MNYDVRVVGAGFVGSVAAERFARRCRPRVLVSDRRDYVRTRENTGVDASVALRIPIRTNTDDWSG